METPRSQSQYENWRASAEKFDYFVVGVLGALCAYISQTYHPVKVGLNSGTGVLLALILLSLGAVFGFLRIEAANQALLINTKTLELKEKKALYVHVLREGAQINKNEGIIYTVEFASKELPVVTERIKEFEARSDLVRSSALTRYRVRNFLTVSGFAVLLIAKICSAYE